MMNDNKILLKLTLLLKKPFRLFKIYLLNIIYETQKDLVKLQISDINNIGYDFYYNGRILYISHPLNIQIGNNVHIGDNAYFQTEGGLVIGDNCHISRNITIYTSDHIYDSSRLPYDDRRKLNPVTIGKNVWIGMNVNILPGVHIGEGAVVGMGTTVTNNIPAHHIVTGQSQRIIGKRDIYNYKTLDSNCIYGGVNGHPIEKDRSLKNIFSSKICKIFILSTGRSGSKSIARILSQNPEVKCYHESRINLIYLSTQYAHGLIKRDQLLEELVTLFNSSMIPSCLIYGESDQKLSNLVPFLNEIFPKSKFIWIIRNAKDVVTSTYYRGWFDDREFGYSFRPEISVSSIYASKIFSANRINGFLLGEFSENDWITMSPFARNCWYWSYWNSIIEENLNTIPKNRKLTVKIEDLDNNFDHITNFIGSNDFEYKNEIHNKAKYNKNYNWSKKMNNEFQFYCADKMKKWYGQTLTF